MGKNDIKGQNPYYEFLTPEALAGLPLLDFPIRMTYGPLWAIISAFVSYLSEQNVVMEFLFFKAVLAMFWLVSLGIICRILRKSTPSCRARAICLFGWLPVSVQMSIGEGHNDIAMVCFLLLWLYLVLEHRYVLSPLILVASALMKYVTAPLIVLELSGKLASSSSIFWRKIAGVSLSLLLIGATFAPFWRNQEFFTPVMQMRGWLFFSPRDAVLALGAWLSLPMLGYVVAEVVSGAFVVAVVYYTVCYVRDPAFSRLVELVLAVLCTVLFVCVGHVWPWFIIWIVAPAALVMDSRLMTFVLPVSFLGPFLNLYWLIFSGWEKVKYASVAFYGVLTVTIVLLSLGKGEKRDSEVLQISPVTGSPD